MTTPTGRSYNAVRSLVVLSIATSTIIGAVVGFQLGLREVDGRELQTTADSAVIHLRGPVAGMKLHVQLDSSRTRVEFRTDSGLLIATDSFRYSGTAWTRY